MWWAERQELAMIRVLAADDPGASGLLESRPRYGPKPGTRRGQPEQVFMLAGASVGVPTPLLVIELYHRDMTGPQIWDLWLAG